MYSDYLLYSLHYTERSGTVERAQPANNICRIVPDENIHAVQLSVCVSVHLYPTIFIKPPLRWNRAIRNLTNGPSRHQPIRGLHAFVTNTLRRICLCKPASPRPKHEQFPTRLRSAQWRLQPGVAELYVSDTCMSYNKHQLTTRTSTPQIMKSKTHFPT